MESELNEARESAYRIAIVVALGISLVPFLCAISMFPTLRQYASHLERQADADFTFCEVTMYGVLETSTFGFDNRTKRAPSTSNEIDDSQQDRTVGSERNEGLSSREDSLSSNTTPCSCKAAPGAKGLPGRKGLSGVRGAPGAPGMPARLPCDPPVDMKKMCPDPCPPGQQGRQGTQGIPGDKGQPGVLGAHGKNGEDGKLGPDGPRGPKGIPGLDGDVGESGIDAMPSPFIPGPSGPMGDGGPIGPQGPKGMPGIDGPQGPIGRRGPVGRNGMPGERGAPGLAGPIGDSGPEGEKGVCPTYCAADGGVFFVEPPEWFFHN